MADSPNNAGRELSDTEKMVQEALAEAQASLNEMQQQTAQAANPSAAGGGAAGKPTGHSLAEISALVGSQDGVQASGIELLSDVDLQVSIELGRTEMLVEDVLKLSPGSVVELDKLAGDPVDVYVNQRLVARGEVLVLNDNFCIRISEIVANLEEEGEISLQKRETI
jgi:flagellar motor switch protein FliN/FliY